MVPGTCSQPHVPHTRASALVVFFSICALGIILTLLGGAKTTRVNWEQGLSDVSGYYFDYMLKDMCQAHELDSQLLLRGSPLL
jgi:hypothetical protein